VLFLLLHNFFSFFHRILELPIIIC
jgi:hypothetical protein